MPAITSIIAAVGVGIAGAGAVSSYSQAQSNADANRKQQEANQQYAIAQNESNVKVRADNQIAIGAQQESEKISQQQMNLDAARRQREIIRQSVAARSQTLAVATAQGGASVGSSALGGAEGGISGRAGVNLLGVTQNQEAGNAIFGQHQIMFNAYRQASIDGYVAQPEQFAQNNSATGAGLSALGGTLLRSSDTIGRVYNYATGSGSNSGIQVGDSNFNFTQYTGT